jgi:potassium efflux system protein
MNQPSNVPYTAVPLWRLCILWLLWVLLPATAVWADDDAAAGIKSAVTVTALKAKVDEVNADKKLDDATRETLLELYSKSIANLEGEAADRAATEEFNNSIEAAPLEAARLEQELADAQKRPFDPYPQFSGKTDSADLAQALLKERANLAAVDADVTRLNLTLKVDQERLTKARQELAQANQQQDRQSTNSIANSVPNEPTQVSKAREQYRETALLALGAKIKRLDQELLSFSPRMQLLKAQIARRELTLKNVRATVALLEDKLGKQRQKDALEAEASAKAAQLEAAGKHPLLVEVAQENAAVSRQLVVQSRSIEAVNKLTNDTEAKATALEEDYRSVRQKLEIAGMNKALGRILQDQRSALPSPRKIRGSLEDKERQIADLALRQLEFEESAEPLKDIDAYAEQLMQGLEPDKGVDRDSLRAELKTALVQRRELYKEASAVSAAYLQSLSDLEYAERRLLEYVERYDAFLGERLLWVRSVPNPGLGRMFALSGERLKYFTPESWYEVVKLIFKLDRFWAPQFAGLLLALGLYWRRQEIRARLFETGKHVGNPVHDRFGYSLQALFWTLLLALPLPLAMAATGMKLTYSADPNALSQALGGGLLWVSECFFFIAVFRELCRPGGLAQRHFLWPEQLLAPLRRESLTLMQTFLPVGFVTALLVILDSSGMEWGVLRITLVLAMLLFGAFFVRLLSNDSQSMAVLRQTIPGSLLVRWRHAWIALAVVIPLVLIGLTLAGYVYTATVLMTSYVDTFWVVISVMLVHQLGLRWLRMTATRLNYQALQEERKRQVQELLDAGSSDVEAEVKLPEPKLQEHEVNLESLGRDSLKVVNIVATFLALGGLFLVWSSVLPALNYLDNVALWSYTGIEDGATTVMQLSLADLGLALLWVGVTYFIYKSLAPVLGLVFLQVDSMSASDSYTIIKVLRYIVLTIGFLMVTGMLGMSWSQFQWLAAALGVGIGFGLQEIVANFISGLIILFERPIRVGDRVTVGDVDGIVTRIQIRATTILTWDRQELLVPNKEFITGRLLNWSLSDQVSRLVIAVGVAYGSDVNRAMRLMEQAARSHKKILEDPPPFVTFDTFGDSSLKLILRCFLDDMGARLTTASELHQAINTSFKAAGIEIAFPQRDINFANDQVLQVNLREPGTQPEQREVP